MDLAVAGLPMRVTSTDSNFPQKTTADGSSLTGGSSPAAHAGGSANTFTVDPKSGGDLATGSWTAVTGVFRLPRVVNDVVYLRVRTTTAIENAKIVYIDHVAMTEMTELYAGGPFIAAFSGKTPWVNGDKYTVEMFNNRVGKIQGYFDRWLGLASKRLLVPVSGGGTTYDDTAYIS